MIYMKIHLILYFGKIRDCEATSVLAGGNAWNGSSDGALYWNSNEPLSNVNVNIGARSFSLYLVFSKMMSHNSLAS